MNIDDILARSDRPGSAPGAIGDASRCPIDGSVLAHVPVTDERDLQDAVARAVSAQRRWQSLPAPRRGELVRMYGNALREAKRALGMLVTLETGKLCRRAWAKCRR
jgi:aldehyde dehydrogenase (NAD+)